MSIKGDSSLNKLILLFLFDKMEVPLTESTLSDITTSKNQWLNYIDFIQTKDALLDGNFITNLTPNTTPIYSITANGRACLADFYTNIPVSKREEIAQFAKNNQKAYRAKQEYVSDFYRNKDGTYMVNLRILELQQPTFELKFIVPTRQIAKNIHNKWTKKAHTTWQTIYEILVDWLWNILLTAYALDK